MGGGLLLYLPHTPGRSRLFLEKKSTALWTELGRGGMGFFGGWVWSFWFRVAGLGAVGAGGRGKVRYGYIPHGSGGFRALSAEFFRAFFDSKNRRAEALRTTAKKQGWLA